MGAGVAELLAQVGVWVTQVYMESSWVMVVYGYALGPHLWATELPIPLQEEISKCTWMLLCIPYFHPNPGPRSRAPCLPSLTITSHVAFCAVFQSCKLSPHPYQYSPTSPVPPCPFAPHLALHLLLCAVLQHHAVVHDGEMGIRRGSRVLEGLWGSCQRLGGQGGGGL